ncbi:MAG: PorT family protein [Clostridium sp.]|nr:PorT family protein [Clostridium sp.]
MNRTLKLKAVALLLLIVATAGRAAAQRYYSPEFYVGVKGGATLSQMSFTPSVKQKMTQGLVGGVVLRYTEEKIFGLIGEINVEQRGWKEDFEATPQFNYDRTLTYIQIPVMTHIYFGRKVKGFVNLGPSVGYMLSSKINANFDYRDPKSVAGFPIQNRTTEQMALEVKNRFDYGICGGLGVEMTFARRHSLMLEGRYYFGIGNIYPSAKKDIFSASRGMSIQVSLAYLFRVK